MQILCWNFYIQEKESCKKYNTEVPVTLKSQQPHLGWLSWEHCHCSVIFCHIYPPPTLGLCPQSARRTQFSWCGGFSLCSPWPVPFRENRSSPSSLQHWTFQHVAWLASGFIWSHLSFFLLKKHHSPMLCALLFSFLLLSNWTIKVWGKFWHKQSCL